MKEFTKGALVTVVEDNDRRIADYKANGWRERPLTPKPQDDADKRIDAAMQEASDSESKSDAKGKGKKDKSKKTAPDKKVNDAVEATKNAAEESEAVDDGLLTNASEGEANG